MIGVRADGRKELAALADGCRESAESNAPHLVALVGAGAVFRNGVLIERPEPAAA